MNHQESRATLPFLRRLLLRSSLNRKEQSSILALTGPRERVDAHRDIVSPGQIVESACLVLRGLAGRFDQMLDGRRQVTSYYIPGDMCDLHSVVVPKASWSITAVSPTLIMRIPHSQLREVCTEYPAIALAFWRDGTVDASIFAKWIGNLGRKGAKARIAHLLCEMGQRMQIAGLGDRTWFDFPVTQTQLADATGITSVHVNRTLQDIRAAGLVSFERGRVQVCDWQALAAAAEFDPSYLLIDEPPQRRVAFGEGTQPAVQH